MDENDKTSSGDVKVTMVAVAPETELRKRKDSLSDGFESDDSMDDKQMHDIVNNLEKEGDQSKQPDSRWAKMKSSVREWGLTSSCHGIPHMAEAHTICAMFVWSVILFFCAIGFVYLFSDTLRQYLAFEKIVKLNLGMEDANFPSITFCNINPYKLSQIKGVKELEALLTVYESSGKSK